MATGQTFSLRDAAKMVGVPYPTVARWVQHRLIRPHDYANRQAVKVRLSDKDMRELRVLALLRGLLSLQELKKAMRYLREKLRQNPLSSGHFIVVSGPPAKRQLVKICESGKAIEVIQGKKLPGQLLIPLCFSESNGLVDKKGV